MIEVYVGPPGGGKSYHAVRRGLEQIYEGRDRYVVANFPITRSKPGTRKYRLEEKWIYLEDIPEPGVLVNIAERLGCVGREGAILLIIDEAGILFNSRDWLIAGEKRKEWIKFFSQSRKLGYDVILIAQDERMIDRQIRACAEFRVKHFTLNQYSIFGWLPIRLFVAVRYWAGGQFRGQLQVYPFLPWVARRYDSMRLFGEFRGVRKPDAGGVSGVPSASGSP